MQALSRVELVVTGSRIAVARQDGLDALERNAALLLAGRTETVTLHLPEQPGAVLHLTLGLGPLALIETPDTDQHRSGGPGAESRAQELPLKSEEVFPDFDAYQ